MIQNLKGIVYPMTDTSTEIIDNGSDNGQNDDATTGLDAEDNQQTSQQDSVSELATVVPITIQEDFLRDLCDNASKHTFQNFPHDGMRNRWQHYTCLTYLPVINILMEWYFTYVCTS